MKFEIPKILKSLRLAEYDAAFGEAAIQVWINPPRERMAQYWQWIQQVVELRKQQKAEGVSLELIKEIGQQIESIGEELVRWFAVIWSQGADETRWTEDDIRELVQHSQDTDPQLWPWVSGKTVNLIQEHRNARKKG